MSGRTSHESANASAGDESAGSGFSLVAVLVFMLIVSAIVVPFAVTAKTRLMIANNEVEQERLSLLAEGLGNVVASELIDGLGAKIFELDFTPAACRAGDLSFDVRVQDHGGLINLNAADDTLLALGFASLGFERQTAQALAKAAIRFRDSAKPFAGKPQPRSPAGPPEDKQAPFESVSELQEFSALASMSLQDLHAVFTVNSERSTISADRAPNRLRAFLARGSSASVTEAAADASAYTVELVVRRDGAGITGEAGFIIKRSPADPKAFWRLSRSPVTAAAASPEAAGTAGCEVLFGAEAAQILQGWSS
ncbi:general secretion pathway protein GspK [Mesorhizobium sp. AR07]|uniref:general secretion pathway protein GspK n=1 Tax=Mesorhizobium sp. AR07 TaxID=2865838 RepID=UPI00215ECCAE|nr:general secretion pathway protein GspK [Mesorhizobium sp. AR07]UVK46530.1 general secretion pathway protein GspK [Mesorhizobium sp. AR07]